MSNSPFFQFYPSDWLAGTRGLTAAETGVYITLVAMMYEREAPINLDRKRLARLCGATPAAFSKIVTALIEQGKITDTDEGLWNDRVQKEVEKRTEKRASAAASANARWQKTEQKQGSVDANASGAHCEDDANQKPETREKEEPNGSSKKKAPAKKRSQLPEGWQLPKEWGDWAIGQGMDELSVRREAAQFEDHHRSHGNTMADWRRAWQKWVRNALNWQSNRRGQHPPEQPGYTHAGAFGRIPEVC